MKRTILAGMIAGLTMLAACGSDDATGSAATEPVAKIAASETTAPIVAPAPTEPVQTVQEQTVPQSTQPDPAPVPHAIVSLSPTATEMLYAIGAGDLVLAVDDFSNFPAETAAKMQGINAFEPNVESIAALEPDLVITDGTNPGFMSQLDTLGIAHWEGPAAVTFDDIYTQIEQLGAATGHVGDAAELVSQMQTDIAAVVAGLPELPRVLTYYHELDPSYFSVTSDTFIGLVYTQAGLVNIADAVGDGNPYPQLNAEFIVSADPDLIFLACTKYCGETPESVAGRDGWGTLKAVTSGGVIAMDDDIASRWGPRVVDYLEAVGVAVTQAAGVPAG
jgi:iron complex transport system substrate-binding protein